MGIIGTATADHRAGLAVQLWSDSNGESVGKPGVKLADLTVPSTVSTGTVQFTAPSNTTLNANTTYHLLIDASKVINSYPNLKVSLTESDAEDSVAAAGWSIANNFLDKTNLESTWTPSAGNASNSLRIEVNGYVNTSTTRKSVVPAAQQAAAQDSEETPAGGSVSFGASAVSLINAVDRVWTVGTRVDQYKSGLPGGGLDFLPEAVEVSPEGASEFEVTYSASGLPAGLTVGYDRVIRGVPSAATNGPVTVTFTATGRALDADGDQIGETSTASLQFQAEVKPPVTFNPASLTFFTKAVLEYTVGQATPLNVTFPRATGGEGPLTYWLDNRELRVPISNYATGLSFNPAVPALTSSVGTDEPEAGQAYALTYWAEDSNGARAVAYGSIAVAAAPKIPGSELNEAVGEALTVGQPASITLPEATGGSTRHLSLQYQVEGQIPGLRFNPQTRTLSGTPTHTGQASFTYTVTDRNNVSDSIMTVLTINSGPSAPTEAPQQITARAIDSGGSALGSLIALDWADVNGATSYVVQMRASNGSSFPRLAHDKVPFATTLFQYSRSQSEDGTTTRASVFNLRNGSYTVRVAAVNADGAGPWSQEATVTLPAAQQLVVEETLTVLPPENAEESDNQQSQPQKQSQKSQFYSGSGDGSSADEDTQQQIARVAPGPVTALQLTATTDSVTVNWQPPEADGNAPKRYIVHLRPENGKKGSGKTKNPKATKTQVTFKKLTPGVTYSVWVRAQNNAGKSERVKTTITLPTTPPQE